MMTRARAVLWAIVSVAAVGCASTHEGRGLVLHVDKAKAAVTVSHEEIAGFMEAMAMPFAVGDPKSLDRLQPGDRIRFRMRVSHGKTRLDQMRLISAAPADSGLTRSPAAPMLTKIGEAMPDFSLIDQNGEAVSLAALRGRVIAVTFIYSRCPLPDYCPRMVSNFRKVRERYADRLGRDLTLLTISFDPKYDTPEVLKRYARLLGVDLPGWRFLTGPPDAIAAVCAAFGIEYWSDQGLITHTLQTAVIDREGKLAATVEGKDYTGQQIADLVGTILGR